MGWYGLLLRAYNNVDIRMFHKLSVHIAIMQAAKTCRYPLTARKLKWLNEIRISRYQHNNVGNASCCNQCNVQSDHHIDALLLKNRLLFATDLLPSSESDLTNTKVHLLHATQAIKKHVLLFDDTVLREIDSVSRGVLDATAKGFAVIVIRAQPAY